MKKILNLYAGIGGNRKLWGEVDDVNVTAVEIDEEIAGVYGKHFPDDKVVVRDAQKYLKEHYEDGWDFIWASPPCPSHSYIRNVCGVGRGQNKMVYPDMGLYEIILFLRGIERSGGTNFDGKYCVENVESWYDPLIEPQEVGRHYLWANYSIPDANIPVLPESSRSNIEGLEDFYGLEIEKYDISKSQMERRKMLRNCVHPELGKHILSSAFSKRRKSLSEF